MDAFTPEIRIYNTKCELEYIDEEYYETPYEQMIVDKAISILTEHLENNDYEFDDDELETIQNALTVMEKCQKLES